VVAAALGGVPSLWGVLAVPAAVLGAVAFAAPLAAYAATQDTDLTFPVIMRLGIVPLFLFSGTFFPISQLPAWIRPVSVVSPLWHAIELCRAATSGTPRWAASAGHTAVLAGCVTVGWYWGRRTFSRRLTP
jgi:lipooligosaccharide transport system permease protein